MKEFRTASGYLIDVTVRPFRSEDEEEALKNIGDVNPFRHHPERDDRVLVATGFIGSIIGGALVNVQEDTIIIKDIVVEQAFLRHGIGAQIVNHIKQMARDSHERAVVTAFLLEDNDPAIRLFASQGFDATEVRDGKITMEHVAFLNFDKKYEL